MSSYALLVGAGDYYDGNIQSLDSIRSAVKKVAETLVTSGGFLERNIKVLTTEPLSSHHLQLATKYGIIQGLSTIDTEFDMKPDDFFLFYFIGHGHGSVESGDHLWPIDTCRDYLPQTTLPVTLLTMLIRKVTAGNKLLVFDCCRNVVEGEMGEGSETFGHSKLLEDDFVCLYSVQPGDFTFIPKGEELPVLTEAFIQAVTDKDCLSIRDLELLVRDAVQRKSGRHIGRRQTPEVLVKGREKGKIGFLARNPMREAKTPEEFEVVIRETNKELHRLYTEVYRDRPASSYHVYMDVARRLNNWETVITNRHSFRRIVYGLFERGDSADLYTASYMLRRSPDPALFEPLVQELLRKKHRGTAVWQALTTIEEMLRDKQITDRLSTDSKIRDSLVAALKKLNYERPIPEDLSSPFSSARMWGRIVDICRRAGIAFEEVFDERALAVLRSSN